MTSTDEDNGRSLLEAALKKNGVAASGRVTDIPEGQSNPLDTGSSDIGGERALATEPIDIDMASGELIDDATIDTELLHCGYVTAPSSPARMVPHSTNLSSKWVRGNESCDNMLDIQSSPPLQRLRSEEATFGYDDAPPLLKPTVQLMAGQLSKILDWELARRPRWLHQRHEGFAKEKKREKVYEPATYGYDLPPPKFRQALDLFARALSTITRRGQDKTEAGGDDQQLSTMVDEDADGPADNGDGDIWLDELMQIDPNSADDEAFSGGRGSARELLRQWLSRIHSRPLANMDQSIISSDNAVMLDGHNAINITSERSTGNRQSSDQVFDENEATFGYDGLPPVLSIKVKPAVDALSEKMSKMAARGSGVLESVAKRAKDVVPLTPDDYTEESTFGFDPLPPLPFAPAVHAVKKQSGKWAASVTESAVGARDVVKDYTASSVGAVTDSVERMGSDAVTAVGRRVQGAAVVVNSSLLMAHDAANVIVNGAQKLPHGVASASAAAVGVARGVAINLSPEKIMGSVHEATRRVLRLRSSEAIQQYAHEVLNFSSQYGLSSYCAENIAGHPRIFPDYGDINKAFALRNYGHWCKGSPDIPPPVSLFSQRVIVWDFIEVRFQTAVHPTSLTVYETYNPGSIVRILARPYNTSADGIYWKEIWAGEPQTNCPKQSRAFKPELRTSSLCCTNVIRLVFDHSGLEYYAQLDAIELTGIPVSEESCDSSAPSVIPNALAVGQISAANSLLLHRIAETPSAVQETNSHFDMLPDELVWTILQHFDLPDLLRVARVNRRLFALSYQVTMGIKALDLQPHWDKVSDQRLFSLITRFPILESLSLSWCSSGSGLLTENGFSTFISCTGTKLKCLRLACCTFVTEATLDMIVKAAPEIQDLDLHCCRNVSPRALEGIKNLEGIKRLNLYYTRCDATALLQIAGALTHLEHLDLGHCKEVIDGEWDNVVTQVARNCPKLKTIDLWRARGLTHLSILELANNCPLLESLDIGWTRVDCAQCVPSLAEKCIGLKQLSLTAIRTVTDACVEALATHSTKLSQLDLLGSRLVTIDAVDRILEECFNIRLLDLSFCPQLDIDKVKQLRLKYDNVLIKSS